MVKNIVKPKSILLYYVKNIEGRAQGIEGGNALWIIFVFIDPPII